MSPYHILKPQKRIFSPKLTMLNNVSVVFNYQELTVDVGRWMPQLSLDYYLFFSPPCFVSLLPGHKMFCVCLVCLFLSVHKNIYLGTYILDLPLLRETLVCAHAYMCECMGVCMCMCVHMCIHAHITQCLLLKTSEENSQKSVLPFQVVEAVSLLMCLLC